MIEYNTSTPILLLVFNRPDLTKQVFSQICKVRPKRLYLAADGPRSPEEKIECDHVRDIITKINWDCTIRTLFREENLGCGKAISQAITWFFENEPEGIILEDDCLPADNFFGFCSFLLEKYRDDNRIGHITGSNFQRGIVRGNGSYYFSSFTNVWGWAGWRRVWKDFDYEMSSYPSFEKSRFVEKLPSFANSKDYWYQNFRIHHTGKINAWGFRYCYSNIINNRISIIPNANLIKNIGCGIKSTHCNATHPLANTPFGELNNIIHPTFIMVDIEADLYAQTIELKIPVSDSILSNDYLFLKNKLLNIVSQKDDLMKIPRIIHQIYQQNNRFKNFSALTKTWKKKHPQWEYRFWDKKDIDCFLEQNYPSLSHIQPDMIRFLILYHFGGLYIDIDYECIEPIESLLVNSSCCVGLECKMNFINYSKPYVIGNALIASVPKHGFLKQIIDYIFNVISTPEPVSITRMYEMYSHKEEITLLPAELVAPLNVGEVVDLLQGNETAEMEEKIEKAFAIHYFFELIYK